MVPQRWGTPYSGAMTHWSWTLLFAHKLLFNSLVFASAIFWLFLPWIYRWAVKLGVTVFGLWFRRPLPLDSFFSFSFLLLFLLMIGGSKISWFTPPCFFAQPYATLRFHKITQRKKKMSTLYWSNDLILITYSKRQFLKLPAKYTWLLNAGAQFCVWNLFFKIVFVTFRIWKLVISLPKSNLQIYRVVILGWHGDVDGCCTTPWALSFQTKATWVRDNYWD